MEDCALKTLIFIGLDTFTIPATGKQSYFICIAVMSSLSITTVNNWVPC